MTLTVQQLAKLRRALEARRAALAEEVREDAERARAESYAELAGATPDIGDESVADVMADTRQAELSRDLDELKRVQAALERLAHGKYGGCEDCGDDIPYGRLQAEPAARRCVACQRRCEM